MSRRGKNVINLVSSNDEIDLTYSSGNEANTPAAQLALEVNALARARGISRIDAIRAMQNEPMGTARARALQLLLRNATGRRAPERRRVTSSTTSAARNRVFGSRDMTGLIAAKIPDFGNLARFGAVSRLTRDAYRSTGRTHAGFCIIRGSARKAAKHLPRNPYPGKTFRLDWSKYAHSTNYALFEAVPATKLRKYPTHAALVDALQQFDPPPPRGSMAHRDHGINVMKAYNGWVLLCNDPSTAQHLDRWYQAVRFTRGVLHVRGVLSPGAPVTHWIKSPGTQPRLVAVARTMDYPSLYIVLYLLGALK